MRDASVATRGEKIHLVLKSVGAQRPSVAEDDRLTRAPVLEINLRSIPCGNCVHASAPLVFRVLNQKHFPQLQLKRQGTIRWGLHRTVRRTLARSTNIRSSHNRSRSTCLEQRASCTV